jgi:hypothetical protein
MYFRWRRKETFTEFSERNLLESSHLKDPGGRRWGTGPESCSIIIFYHRGDEYLDSIAK